MKNITVLLIDINPRSMALVSPSISLLSSILKNNGIKVQYFDTTFYDKPEKYINTDKYKLLTMGIKNYKKDAHYKEHNLKNFKQLLSDLQKIITESKPDIIMTSVMESSFLLAIDVLREIRKHDIPHVMGGIFAMFQPELIISYPEIDVVCTGEAETILVPLCEKIVNHENLQELPNLIFKKNGEIIRTPLAPPVDLDNNPLPDMSIYNERRFYRSMAGRMYRMFPVESHRGCPGRCRFCGSALQNSVFKNSTGRHFFRKKSIHKLIEEIDYLVKICKAEYLHFWADNFFTYTQKEIDLFCNYYSAYKVPFYVQSFPSMIDEQKIKNLHQVGLHRMGLGVEHGDEEFRRKITGRDYSNKMLLEKINIVRKYVPFSTNNIVGFPLETPELHMCTVKLNREIDPDSAGISIFTPFRGTPLREQAIELGFLKDTNAFAPTNNEASILDMPQFPPWKIFGKARVFNLYLKFPIERWPEIEEAEKNTEAGNRIFVALKEEYQKSYE